MKELNRTKNCLTYRIDNTSLHKLIQAEKRKVWISVEANVE
jgi:hypothetical protein